MNNAMEAVEYLPESERWIRADIHEKADYLVIAVENPFAEKYLGMEKGGGIVGNQRRKIRNEKLAFACASSSAEHACGSEVSGEA